MLYLLNLHYGCIKHDVTCRCQATRLTQQTIISPMQFVDNWQISGRDVFLIIRIQKKRADGEILDLCLNDGIQRISQALVCRWPSVADAGPPADQRLAQDPDIEPVPQITEIIIGDPDGQGR